MDLSNMTEINEHKLVKNLQENRFYYCSGLDNTAGGLENKADYIIFAVTEDYFIAALAWKEYNRPAIRFAEYESDKNFYFFMKKNVLRELSVAQGFLVLTQFSSGIYSEAIDASDNEHNYGEELSDKPFDEYAADFPARKEKHQRGNHMTAKDYKHAGRIAKKFMENTNETYLYLHVGSGNSIYTIAKLPYGENMYLLYADKWFSPSSLPGTDLKYAGFYSREHKQSYDLREPINGFFEFGGKQIYEGELQRMVKTAIQKTAAEYIIKEAQKYDGMPLDDLKVEILGDAETAYSKKETALHFYEKFPFDEWYVSKTAMVEYIDNPNNVYDPDSWLKQRVDALIGQEKDKEKYIRLWFAHCMAQKLLDGLYAAEKNNDI
jgi:hypothetical protein